MHQIKKAVHKALLLNCLIFVALCESFEFVVKTTFDSRDLADKRHGYSFITVGAPSETQVANISEIFHSLPAYKRGRAII